MNERFKGRRKVYGNDSERFASRLFLLQRNPDGDRRPDLTSVNGLYTPRLSLEVKSGFRPKGVLVRDQLHYGYTTAQDYADAFGEEAPTEFPENEVAYYYCTVHRANDIRAGQLGKPWSAIQFNWGEQYIAPHQYAFAAFAAAHVSRSGKRLSRVVDWLKKGIQRDIIEGSSHYRKRKKTPETWQDMHGGDFLAFFYDDVNHATKKGRKRVEMIRKVFPQVDDLIKIEIPGPNGFPIYILAEKEHADLFNLQVRAVVEQRIPVVEKVHRARVRARALLAEVPSGIVTYEKRKKVLVPYRCIVANGLFIKGKMREDYVPRNFTPARVVRLEDLTNWRQHDEGDVADIARDFERKIILPSENSEDTSFEFGANVAGVK